VRTLKQIFERSEREYSVEGAICFEMVSGEPGKPAELEFLRTAILDADKKFPWQDEADSGDGPKVESIHYLGQADEAIDNTNPRQRRVWFSIHPFYTQMRQSQTYAYDRYLAKIAQAVAKSPDWRGIVREVRSISRVSKMSRFPVK
jgi:hypothetical protein